MQTHMSLDARIALLMDMAGDDREGPPQSAPPQKPPRLRHADDVGALRPINFRQVRMGRGGKVSLMRILMTNACSFNCHYCPMRRDRSMPRTLLKPEELARIFISAHRRGWCEGLFVTTGIPGRPVKVMDDLIAALEIIREHYLFRGYIHVKMVPGADSEQIARLTHLASRVSINLEAPCGAHLRDIAPEKNLDATLADLEQVRTLVVLHRREQGEGRPVDALHPGGTAGMTMQFVVGATVDTDRTILGKVSELYARSGIHHAHFSAFRPIRDTPMENVRATPWLREQRLYQADHLMRDYGFAKSEVIYGEDGNLPLAVDPKSAWAIANSQSFPVEIQTATLESLLRVPGIGPTSARRIVEQRVSTRFRSLADLRAIGVVTTRAAGFLTLRGRRLQNVKWSQQLGFWQPEEQAGTPHVIYDVSPGTFR